MSSRRFASETIPSELSMPTTRENLSSLPKIAAISRLVAPVPEATSKTFSPDKGMGTESMNFLDQGWNMVRSRTEA
jgi:hypothetical protein